MHELSVALDLVDAALEEATRGGFRVARLHVKVGPLSGVDAEALRSAFELAAAGTPLEGADLELTEEAITAWCNRCQEIRILADPWSRVCSSCSSPLPELLTGAALELSSLKVEDHASPNR